MVIVKRDRPFTVVCEWDGTGETPDGVRLTVNGVQPQEAPLGSDATARFGFPAGLPLGQHTLEAWFFTSGGDGPHATEVVQAVKQSPNAVVKITVTVE